MENTPIQKEKTKSEAFVKKIIQQVEDDTACRAALTRADNPKLESYGWKYILSFCNSDIPSELTAYSIVAAAIARVKPSTDGSMNIGEALRASRPDGDAENKSAELKLNRLLACDNRNDLFAVLPRTIRYLQAQEKVKISYAKLIDDILYWNTKTKIKWAKSFYLGKQTTESEA